MSDTLKAVIIIIIPLLGTTLGAGMVFFLKNEIRPGLQKALTGFAAGVMIAASVWSLILPAMEMAEEAGKAPWAPAVIGFLAGIAFLLLLDVLIPHLHINTNTPEGRPSKFRRDLMLVLAVTLHNIPEGLAVGVVIAGMLNGGSVITVAGAIILAVGIAIQNFPEGAVVSTPLVSTGMTKRKAFRLGFMSGVVEPISSVIAILITGLITSVLPYVLSFAAGAMIYVVVDELIPEAQAGEKHSNIGTIGASLGFALMLLLDSALG